MKYRIKTFSINADIHIHKFTGKIEEEAIKIADSTTLHTYGDIIEKSIKIEFSGNGTEEELDNTLKINNLSGKFEISNFVFWNPDGRIYSTKSKPE